MLQVADRGKQPIKAAAGAAQQCDSTHLGAQAAQGLSHKGHTVLGVQGGHLVHSLHGRAVK